jgi:hypothetical protein
VAFVKREKVFTMCSVQSVYYVPVLTGCLAGVFPSEMLKALFARQVLVVFVVLTADIFEQFRVREHT